MSEKLYRFKQESAMPKRRRILRVSTGLMAILLLAGTAMHAEAGQTKAATDHSSRPCPTQTKEYTMSKSTYVQEYNAIVEVLNKYIEGNAKASSAVMKPAFHEKATIFGLNDQDMFGPEIQKLYDVIDTFKPSPNAKAAITRIDIAGTAASARVDSDNVAGFCFTDFFNLLKIDGKWTIVSKIYYTHPTP